MTRDVADRLEDSTFRYAQSHQNDPLGCAIAKQVVTVIRKDGLVERSNRVGTDFLRELEHLGKRYDVVRKVRGRGLMIAMEFEDNDEYSSVTSVYHGLLERGFILSLIHI